MRSIIIIEVEHGESTDVVQDIAESVAERYHEFVTDYTVRVDLPECFKLDTNSVAPEWHDECDTDHDPGKCPLGES